MSYKRWLLLAAIIFGFGIAVGVVTPPDIISEDIIDFEEIGELVEMSSSALLIFILLKNSLAFLISFALSPVLWLAPFIALIFNGWVLGVVSVAVLEEQSLGVLLAGLLPHGIFEIPAFIMAEAAALSFGTAVIVAIFRKEKRSLVLPSFRQNMRYLAVALLLLLPAAVIEAYVTPLMIGRAGG